MSENQIQGLQQYIVALEKQNRSQLHEQDVLYRQLERLNTELKEMEQYYFKNRELLRQVDSLRHESQSKDEEIDKLIALVGQLQEKLRRNSQAEEIIQANAMITCQLKEKLSQTTNQLSHIQQILDLQRTTSSEQLQSNQKLKTQLEIKYLELIELKLRLSKSQTAQSDNISPQNSSYSSLLKKCAEIEEQSEEREEKMKELQEYVDQLEYRYDSLNNDLEAKEVQLRQLKIELSYRQKQQRYTLPVFYNKDRKGLEKERERFSRSQAHTPKNKQVNDSSMTIPPTERSRYDDHQDNHSLIIKAPSEDLDRDSVSSSTSQARRLQKRNSILKMQNDMLRRNMEI